MSAEGNKIIVGKVTGVYGVKGWIKVYSWTEPRENIATYNPWFLKGPNDSDWHRVELETAKRHGKTVVAKLAGLDDRDEAMCLTGQEIAIDESQIAPPGEDEFYWRELIGLRVMNRQGTELGEVRSLMETGANDVLVVVSADGREHLVPWVPGEVVTEVDLVAQTMEVDWDTAWLDD